MQSQYSQWNIAFPMVNIPNPRWLKIMYFNIPNKPGTIPQILIDATIKVFKFTKIQWLDHKIVQPTCTTTEWNERSSAKTSSHGLLTCSSHFLVMVAVYWLWHTPAKIKHGDDFCVLTGMSGMWIFFDT